MSSTKEYKNYILEQLKDLEQIRCRSMMGEFLLYYKEILFGGIYNDSLLVKIVDENKKYWMKQEIPYAGAKPMYLVSDIDNKDLLEKIVVSTYEGLIRNNIKIES